MTRTLLPTILVLTTLAAVPAVGAAQSSEPSFVLGGAAGFATTWDDEGLLGRGGGISGSAGVRLTPRLTLSALVDRVGYFRDVEWLTFDGRMLFAGAELEYAFGDAGVRPYLSAGAGALNDSGTWVRKVQTGPGQSRVDEIVNRSGTRTAMTVSGGIDIPVSSRVSVRGGLRFYGLIQTGDDLFPHISIQPQAAAVIRF